MAKQPRGPQHLAGAARIKLLGPQIGGLQQSKRQRKYHSHAIPHVKLQRYMREHPGATPNEAQIAYQEGQTRTKLLRTADRSARRSGLR